MEPRSPVWEHFTHVEDERGKLVEAECKHCSKRFVTEHGTASMRKHVGSTTCKGRVGQPQPQPQTQLLLSGPGESSCREPAVGLELEDEEASRDLARMIALHGYDPSVVEDDYFRSFVRRLNPQFKLPSRDAIEEICPDIFRRHWGGMLDSCLYAPGRLSLAVGIAKTKEAGQVLYTTCQFIDDEWNLHKVVVGARVILPQDDDHNHVSSLFDIPVVSHDNVVDRVMSDLCETYDEEFKCTLFMMARGMTSDIIDYGELKDRIDKIFGSDSSPSKNRVVICIPPTWTMFFTPLLDAFFQI
ncbi:zinc finger BED domain-containing protein RICESLEEPER 1-like [Panicum virgatum]|uniref:BED-type domain-containing protein n=1 Tax=Panicum virgatum TaxID=38727 RepID=A0A8T0R6H6_PANVG|nr:zinc finger BED domain-containing protein RICESLEEPER 1-like [Panicum virgatum]KAG2581322.1 hypothetical protein PVAP13_6KG240001 [Panicum virgatum]